MCVRQVDAHVVQGAGIVDDEFERDRKNYRHASSAQKIIFSAYEMRCRDLKNFAIALHDKEMYQKVHQLQKQAHKAFDECSRQLL
jgi:hypothetical protein